MCVEKNGGQDIGEMSAEEARRYLIRLLGKQDLEEHSEIYEELARE
jgi:hypothetical protein